MKTVIMAALMAALALASSAQAATVILFNNSMVVPGEARAYKLDTSSKTGSLISDKLNGYYDWVSTTVYCDGVIYGSADDVPIQPAIGRLTLSDGTATFFKTKGNAHAVTCGRNPGSVLAVMSQPVDGRLMWTLEELDTNSTSATPRVIAVLSLGNTIYAGSDAAFRFVPGRKELWISAASSNYNGGALYVFDLETGAPKGGYSFPGIGGYPYMVLPPNQPGSNSFGVGMNPQFGDDITFYQASLNGQQVSLGSGSSQPFLFNGGMPPAVCDGIGYTLGNPGSQPQMLYSFDIATGAKTATINLNDAFNADAYFGAVTCSS